MLSLKLDKNKLQKYRSIARDTEDQYINIQPIQRGGVLTPEAQKVLVSYGDGYSMCDFCFEGRVDLIEKPPVHEFLGDLATFLDIDEARVTPGSRTAMYTVMRAMAQPGDTIVLDSLAHYSTYIAAESAQLKIREVPHQGAPEFALNLDDYRTRILEIKKETGKNPALLILTHVDYNYGNVNDLLRSHSIQRPRRSYAGNQYEYIGGSDFSEPIFARRKSENRRSHGLNYNKIRGFFHHRPDESDDTRPQFHPSF